MFPALLKGGFLHFVDAYEQSSGACIHISPFIIQLHHHCYNISFMYVKVVNASV